MGEYLSADEVEERFAKPLQQLAKEFRSLCERWNDAYASGKIAKPDLLLNDQMPENGLKLLRKLYRETEHKLDDAVEGVYRYRKNESRSATGSSKRTRR